MTGPCVLNCRDACICDRLRDPAWRAAFNARIPEDATKPPTETFAVAFAAADKAVAEARLTPSEVALARALAAWVEWASAGKPENDDAIGWSLRGIEKSLFIFGFVRGNEPSVSGAALLDRARKAGVL